MDDDDASSTDEESGGGEAEGITPKKGREALRDAVKLFELKAKPANLPFAPLIEATRATDFGRPALTDKSSRDDLAAGCKALAGKLEGLALKKPKELVDKCAKLMRMLKWRP